jgi:hypothetical protein
MGENSFTSQLKRTGKLKNDLKFFEGEEEILIQLEIARFKDYKIITINFQSLIF